MEADRLFRAMYAVTKSKMSRKERVRFWLRCLFGSKRTAPPELPPVQPTAAERFKARINGVGQ